MKSPTLPLPAASGALSRLLPSEVTGPLSPNPAPFDNGDQNYLERVQALAGMIVEVYLNSLPSNYVSMTGGPLYVQEFRAVAAELARIQLAATEAYEDLDFNFTRPEVLYQFLGCLVFPEPGTGLEMGSDLELREFLRRMVGWLLAGSRASAIVQGLEFLVEGEAEAGVRSVKGEQFLFDVEVSHTTRTDPTEGPGVARHTHRSAVSSSGEGATTDTVYETEGGGPPHTHPIQNWEVAPASAPGLAAHGHALAGSFPDFPERMRRNVGLVLAALGPAENLYRYVHVFREIFRVWSDQNLGPEVTTPRYEDYRKNWGGLGPLTGSNGVFLSGRTFFGVPGADFRHVKPGGSLRIPFAAPPTGSPREAVYQLGSPETYPYGDDPVDRPYLTSPTGLSGLVRVVGGALEDSAQDWSLAVPGETLTVLAGPNAWVYRLDRVLGPGGGPVGRASAGTRVVPLPSLVRVTPPPSAAASGLAFELDRDPGGVNNIRSETEDVSSQAWGSSGSFTEVTVSRGPLVNGSGAWAPATWRDVQVLRDGSPIAVAELNPYTGRVTLAAPQARWSPGDHTLTVAYCWFPSPVLPFAGLNRPGLALNTVARRPGFRFPMTLALGTGYRQRPSPFRIAHRFIALERESSAVLNSPRSLLLNAAPGRVAVPPARISKGAREVTYQPGEGSAPAAPWQALGPVPFAAQNGSYALPATAAGPAYWHAEVPFCDADHLNMAARLEVSSAQPEGVWTGVALGAHDATRLYLAGALLVPNPRAPGEEPLPHLGILLQAKDPSLLSSWYVGPQALGRVAPRAQPPSPEPGVTRAVTFAPEALPYLLSVGDRFQVLEGSQTGIYRVEDHYSGSDGRTVVVVEPPFPADPSLAGNQEITAVFETRWDRGPATWRFYVNRLTQQATLFYGGATGAVLSRVSARLAGAATLLPDLTPASSGMVFWGHLGRTARSVTRWYQVAAACAPEGNLQTRITERTPDPARDPEDQGWAAVAPWGWSQAVESGARRYVASLAASNALATRYAYGYRDPYQNGKRVYSLEARVQLLRSSSGAGGASLVLRDPYREVHLGALMYFSPGSGKRTLYSLPTVSLVGSVSHESQGWELQSELQDVTEVVSAGPCLRLRGGSSTWTLSNSLDLSGWGSYLQARLAVTEAEPGSDDRLGLWLGCDFQGRRVVLEWLSAGRLSLSTGPRGTQIDVVTVAPSWGTADSLTYELRHTLDGYVSLWVEGAQVSSLPLSSFPATSDTLVRVGYEPDPTPGWCAASLVALSWVPTVEGVPGLGRTWGIYLGGDPEDIDSWAIPRSDSSGAPNSSDTLAVPVPMDWTAECWVRLFVDPTYGAVFQRPDLAAPPGYTGDWATQSLDPTAAWVRVEYARLPARAQPQAPIGEAFWGVVRTGVAADSVWRGVRYRLFTNTSTDYRAPLRMVLNRAAVVTSGEFLRDTTPETVVVASVNRYRVSLRPANRTAARIWNVIVEGEARDPGEWSFNPDHQEVFFHLPLPHENTPVTVVFAPGKPVTTTYLQAQPMDCSPTVLGEGTPPIEWSQVGSLSWETVSGDGGPVPVLPPALPTNPAYFLRDPYTVRAPVEGPHRYERLTALSRDNAGLTGLVTTWTDSWDGESGPRGMTFSGAPWSETMASPRGRFSVPDRGPVALVAGGGSRGGVARLGPGSTGATLPLAGGARERWRTWDLSVRLREVESWSSPVDSGSLRVQAPGEYSRVGPWGGLNGMNLSSRLAGTSYLQPEGVPPGARAFTLAGGAALPPPATVLNRTF